MTAISVILGILLAIAGVVCLTTPLGTTFSLMYLFMILLFVIGIISFIRCIVRKSFGAEFIFSILTITLGIFILCSPYATFLTEVVMIYLMAGWLIVRGVVGIFIAAEAKAASGGGLFAAALILSILTILAGIYSFFHPMVFSGFLGVLAGAFFIIGGIDMVIDAVVSKPNS